jgi:hypothetical protein
MAANAGELVEGLSIGVGAVITSSALASASGFMLAFVLSNFCRDTRDETQWRAW